MPAAVRAAPRTKAFRFSRDPPIGYVPGCLFCGRHGRFRQRIASRSDASGRETQTAVADQRVAGHEVVADEKCNRLCDVFGASHARAGSHAGDPAFAELVAGLRDESAEFRTWWYELPDHAEIIVVVYTAVRGSENEERLRRLSGA